MNRIAIIGSGALGTALGKVLIDAGHKNLIIYGIDKDELKDLSSGFNKKYFENVKFSKFDTTSSLEEAILGADYIVLAIPSFAIADVYANIITLLKKKVIIINGSKGFYSGTEESLHAGLLNNSKGNKYVRGVVSLIGPSHAEEIVIEAFTTVAAVGENILLDKEIQKLFKNKYFKVYIQPDVKGAEVGASYKNVLAIASGMLTGLGYGINSTAALLTRGINEMLIFNKAMGGKDKTLMGLTGIGDVIVTATSRLSRNFNFGYDFIKTKGKSELEKTSTVEGIDALKKIYKISKTKKLDLPIVHALYSIIIKNSNVKKTLKKIWNRKLINE